MVHVPNEMLKQITETFDRDAVEGSYTLRQLRLVNRTFNDFATKVLFHDYDTFSLGSSREDMAARVRALESSSYFRNRVRNIIISRSALLPRALQMKDPQELRETQLSMDFLKAIHGGFHAEFLKLLTILGPGFRFQQVYVDDRNERCVNTYFASGPSFADLRSVGTELFSLLELETFEAVTRLQGRFRHTDLQHLLNQTSFLSSIQELDIDISSFERYGTEPRRCFTIGKVIQQCHVLRTFTLRSSNFLAGLFSAGGDRTPDESLADDQQRELKIKTNVELRVKIFQLMNSKVENAVHLWTTLVRFQNVTTLSLSDTKLRESSAHKWSDAILIIIVKFLTKLVVFKFAGLGYFASENEPMRMKNSKLVYDKESGRSYRRPIRTPFLKDIDATYNLLQCVIERREGFGLPEDPWMSFFYSKEDVLSECYSESNNCKDEDDNSDYQAFQAAFEIDYDGTTSEDSFDDSDDEF